MNEYYNNLKDYTKKKIKKLRKFNLKDQDFLHLKCAQVLCSIYILIATLIHLDDFKKTGAVENKWQTFCLVVSKISAFAMYPLLITVFLSKCRATLNFITKTPISLFIPEVSRFQGFVVFFGNIKTNILFIVLY